jgi:hypothetical protein
MSCDFEITERERSEAGVLLHRALSKSYLFDFVVGEYVVEHGERVFLLGERSFLLLLLQTEHLSCRGDKKVTAYLVRAAWGGLQALL